MVAALVAGPAISRTRAAPGLSPFSISTAAIGTEAVAHIYTGMAASSIISISSISLDVVPAKKLSGMKTARRAAITSPIISHPIISCRNSTKEYLNISFSFGKNPFGRALLLSLSPVSSTFSLRVKLFVRNPPEIPVNRATIGLIIAKGNPRRE